MPASSACTVPKVNEFSCKPAAGLHFDCSFTSLAVRCGQPGGCAAKGIVQLAIELALTTAVHES